MVIEDQHIELKDLHITTVNGNVYHVIPLGKNESGELEYICVSDVLKFKPQNVKEYASKKEAYYEKTLKSLKNGARLSKYKSSKYYKYYIRRLEKEHPEMLV